MGLLDALLGGSKTETEIDLEKFTARRKQERREIETLAVDWLITTGLWEIFLDQREDEYDFSEYQREYINGVEFDPRRDDIQEIVEFVENAENTVGDPHVASREWENDLEPYEDAQDEIYEELLTRGPLTDEEIMETFDEMDMPVREAALSRLTDKGKIRPVTVAGRDGYKARGR